LKAKFLWGRTGIFFIPVIGFLTILLLYRLHDSSSKIFKNICKSSCVILILFLAVHLLMSADITRTSWSRDADTRKMLENLSREYEKEFQKTNINLGADWILEPSIGFYRTVDNLSWLRPVTRDSLEKEYDFLYAPEPFGDGAT
jgi:hypothetical protein